MDVAGGMEARFGRTICNCQWGLEGVYWGIFPNDEFCADKRCLGTRRDGVHDT